MNIRNYIKQLLLEFSEREKYSSLSDALDDYGFDQWIDDLFDDRYGDDLTHYFEMFFMDTDANEDEYQERYGNDYSKRWMEDEDFSNYMRDIYEDLIYNIDEPKIVNNRVIVYRAMYVDKRWLNNLPLSNRKQHLGIYWSAIEDGAEVQWGSISGYKIYITASVPMDAVDWMTSVQLNLAYATGTEEKEIRMFDNAPMRILDITDGDSSLEDYYSEDDWDLILGNTYYA